MESEGNQLATQKAVSEIIGLVIALYGSESWTLKEDDKKKITSFELWVHVAQNTTDQLERQED